MRICRRFILWALFYFSVKTYVVIPHKDHLSEIPLLRAHKNVLMEKYCNNLYIIPVIPNMEH